MLEKLDAAFAEEVVAVAQLLGNLPAQVVALCLEDFDGAFLFFGHGNACPGGRRMLVERKRFGLYGRKRADRMASLNVQLDYYHYRHSGLVSQARHRVTLACGYGLNEEVR